MMLMRSPKPYDEKTVCFRHSDFLSKPEIKQYLQKLYNMPITEVHTHRHMGKFMKNNDVRTSWRRKDWKKSMVKVDYEVNPEYQKIM